MFLYFLTHSTRVIDYGNVGVDGHYDEITVVFRLIVQRFWLQFPLGPFLTFTG